MCVLVIYVVVLCIKFVGALKSSLKAKGYPTLNKMSNQMKSNGFRAKFQKKAKYNPPPPLQDTFSKLDGKGTLTEE